jgi:hypothetical protein
MNIFICFANDPRRIRWHVVDNSLHTYKLASCGFNNQITQIIGKETFAEKLADGKIVREAA